MQCPNFQHIYQQLAYKKMQTLVTTASFRLYCLKMLAKKQLSSLDLPRVDRRCEGIDQRLNLVML